MKNIFFLIILIGFSNLCFSQNEDRPSTPKELGELVFEALKENDFQAFQRLVFTESDCEIMIENAQFPDKVKNEIVQQMKGVTKMTRNKNKVVFNHAVHQVKDQCGSWTKVKLKDVKFEINNRNNVKSADVFILCKYKGKELGINLDNCHKSDAWLMMGDLEVIIK